MEVKINKPKPVAPPPTTYDITGLTRDEMFCIRAALIRCSPAVSGEKLWTSLHDDIASGMNA